jgi:hypothetical protein
MGSSSSGGRRALLAGMVRGFKLSVLSVLQEIASSREDGRCFLRAGIVRGLKFVGVERAARDCQQTGRRPMFLAGVCREGAEVVGFEGEAGNRWPSEAWCGPRTDVEAAQGNLHQSQSPSDFPADARHALAAETGLETVEDDHHNSERRWLIAAGHRS